jgi:hypothetical protein
MSIVIAAAILVLIVLLYVVINHLIKPKTDNDTCISIEKRKDPQKTPCYLVKNRFGSPEERATDPAIPRLIEPDPEPEPEPEGKFIKANDLKDAEPISVEEFQEAFAVHYGLHKKLPRPMRDYPETPIEEIRDGQRGFIHHEGLLCTPDGTLLIKRQATVINTPMDVAVERDGEQLIVTLLEQQMIPVTDKADHGCAIANLIFVVNEIPPDNNINNW